MRKFRKNTLLELLKILPNGDYVVQNEGDSTDIWTIPKATFESTYDEIEEV
jgi:hypothetical protein